MADLQRGDPNYDRMGAELADALRHHIDFHKQLVGATGGSGEFIGNGEDRCGELFSVAVASAAEIEEYGHTRRTNGDADRLRAARDAAYHFMSAMAGNLAHFEEASRALFADDRRRFTSLIAAWPADIREHVVKLAYADAA